MSKKLIITENAMKYIINEGILSKSDVKDIISSSEFEKKVKSLTKDAVEKDKEIEKLIKKIITKNLAETFRALWQRKTSWEPMV